MATHSSILAWKTPMDRGVWQAIVHGVAKELDMTEHAYNATRLPSLNFHSQMYYYGRKRNFYSFTFLLQAK